MRDNQNKYFVFFASLLLFGCAVQSAPAKPVENKPIAVNCYPSAANELLRWNKANGKVLNGLTKRRQAEMNLFLKGCDA